MWDFYFKLNHVQQLLESRFLRRTLLKESPHLIIQEVHDIVNVLLWSQWLSVYFWSWCFLSQKTSWAEIRFAQGKELVQKLKQRYKDVGRPKDVCNMDVMLELSINAHSIHLCHVYLYIFICMYIYIYTVIYIFIYHKKSAIQKHTIHEWYGDNKIAWPGVMLRLSRRAFNTVPQM